MRCLIQCLATITCVVFLCVPSLVSAQPNKIIDDIVQEAIEAYGKVNDYTAHLFRVERVGGELRKEELISLKFRKPMTLPVRIKAPSRGAAGSDRTVR